LLPVEVPLDFPKTMFGGAVSLLFRVNDIDDVC